MFEPVQLRTFLAVAQTLSFTQAAKRLDLRQSTVSQHVRRLEDAAGCRLFVRDTHGVDLTEDGEAMLGFARTILAANERAVGFFAGTRLRGRLRFGVSEDFVLTRLPEILSAFRREHPEVDLELTVELSGTLHRMLDAGQLDLCLAKRSAPDGAGQLVFRDTLVWIGSERMRLDPRRPVPLIAFPAPGITRARALEVLERHGRDWRVACTSASLSGLVAAARAGLGVMAHARSLVPAGLVPLPSRAANLPELGGVDFVLLHGRAPRGGRPRGAAQEAADALSRSLLAAGDTLHRPLP
ncbi:putative LysR family transcriptional regulator [Actinacidiphila reveromycinica]|uniref:Putative LysR family transcriptional regulator n=1 Tax=Actinacidiphila reveromycinica TaxID=659352 RepID=A0A7U3VRT7_9ACTN|nr:putative LysR family transcriptional regulator [Streptomyces sp. SN-593]